MMTTVIGRWKRIGKRAFRILLSAMFALQTFSIPATSLADGSFSFRGYNSENINGSTFNYATSDVSVSGTTVRMNGTTMEGSAQGIIVLNEGVDISTSIDLGGLEIDFSTVCSVTEEGEAGVENDVPSVKIEFCGSSDGGGVISSVHLTKSDKAESGNDTLSSGASIPKNTRAIVITLTGKNTTEDSENTVVFSDTSLVIHDSSAPRCVVERNEDWTNQDITITVNASDSDSGLEGIYIGGERVTQESSYSFVVTENGASYSIYSMDYAGKQSEVSEFTIGNIDKTTPSTPDAITLGTTDWTNANVSVTMSALSAGSGAPERYVYQLNGGAWADLPDSFALSENGINAISVAVEDAAGNRSGSVSATAKIDKLAPSIGSVSQTVGSGTAIVSVSATDEGLSGIKRFCYAAGDQTAEYFTTGGNDISDSSFTVHIGGTYTLYAEDSAGNIALKKTELSTAPVLEAIADMHIDEDETKIIPLALSDAESALSELSIHVSTTNDDLLSSVSIDRTESRANLVIKPELNQFGGPVKVTVTVSDPSDQTISRAFNVTVDPVNDLPIAVNDSGIKLTEDSRVEVPVLENDSDAADGDTLSILSVGKAAHGTTMIVLDKIRYTPDANFYGTDQFNYEISDGHEGTATATVSVTVENINDAPTATRDTASTMEDLAVSIPVLTNDSDADMVYDEKADSIQLVSCTKGTHGTTSIDGNNVIYTPATDYNGTDTFTYLIEDQAGLSSEAVVSVTISPIADDPWFSELESEYNINEDSHDQQITFEIHDVETPANSLMLQAASLNAELLDQSKITVSGLGDESASVTLSITPQANQNGDVVIHLTLGDGFVTVVHDITVHVLSVNDAPNVKNDTITYSEDTEFVDIKIADLLSDDSDVENDTLFFDSLETNPTVGRLETLDSATLRYYPAKDYDGADSFTYYVSDGTARTIATCTLKATGVNDAPTISTALEEFSGSEDTLIVIPFIVSDNESIPTKLEVIVASDNQSLVTTRGITVQINSDGTGEVRIQPEADANGDAPLTLTVTDGEGQTSIEIVLHVAPVQDAPVAVDDNIVIQYSSKREFSVLTNDYDVDGDTLSVKTFSGTLPGTLTYDKTTQLFTYRPATGENGTVSFTYILWDGTAETTGTGTLQVTTVKHNPVITAIDTKYVVEDGSIDGVAFSVSDEDAGDTANISFASSNTALLPADDTHIAMTNHENGEYTLKLSPIANKTGSATITVTVTDGTGLTDSTTFTLIVLDQNDAPVAAEDNFTVDEDGTLELKMLANDSDPDGDTIWLSGLSTPLHGSIERVVNTYSYVPYEDWYGTETLTYSISDGRASASSSITITVNSINDAPVAWEDYCAMPNVAEESRSIDVIHNDYDVDTGDVIRIDQIITQPKYGTALIKDGKITYTRTSASPEGNGADSFVYRIIDRDTATGDYRYSDAKVYIGVEFHSSLYTYGRKVTCMEDADAFTFDLTISNPNEVPYTLTVDTLTTLGTFTVVDNNTVSFKPAANQYGSANITYTIQQTDGTEKDTGTIWLRVYPVNDLPEIDNAPASITMEEDTSAGSTFDVKFHDADCATRVLYFYVYTTDGSTVAPMPFQTGYTVTRTDDGATVTVKTAENVNGTAKIVVGVSDGMTCDERTIDLTVTPVDDAPVVANVNRTIHEDSSVVFASPGSDSEVDGDAIMESIADTDKPVNGTATIRPNKTICYVPNENFFGTETFYVTVTDKTTTALSSRAKVTIVVEPVNDQPEISNLGSFQTTLEDTAKDVTLTLNDVDNDITKDGVFTLTSYDESIVKEGAETLSISRVSDNQMVIHIVPEANAYGTVKIGLVASDGALSAEGAFELKVIPVNDAPIAQNDIETTLENISTGLEATAPQTTATMNLLANDSDIEDGKPRIVSISDVVRGTVTNIGGGEVLVSADGNFSGSVTFTYTVMDLAGAKTSATGTLNITAQNDPPRAVNNAYTINEDTATDFSVLANDSDPEGDTLTISGISGLKNGSATIDGTKIAYVPNANYNGADSFSYTISDGKAEATATVYVTIKPVNDAPTIAKHSSTAGIWTMDEDITTPFNFVVADPESPVNRLIIKIVSTRPELIQTSQIALTTNSAGYKTITVTPELNANGTVPVKFLVSDGLLTTEATYDIVINSVNDAPVVTAPSQTVKEDEKLTASVSATDSDGDVVTFSVTGDPQHGSVTMKENGDYTYQPNPNFNGEDWFEVTANDNQDENNTGVATVYITVTPVGDAPTAVDDKITLNEDTPTTILVLANDTDEDSSFGDVISVLRFTTPAHGTLTKTDTGILYTPAENYNGEDSFYYTIADLDGKLDTAKVSITVSPVNDAPANGNDTATTDEDTAVTIDAVANDDLDETTNPDLEDVTITDLGDPMHGTATLSADKKSILYTPDANWFSPDGKPEVFSYTATDKANKSATFSVTVTVNSVNDLPVITPDDLPNVSTDEDTTSSAITFNVSDVEDAAGTLTVSVTHNNSVLLPTVSVTPDASGNCSFTVKPLENKVGDAKFTVTVTDDDGGTDSDTFTLKVIAINDLPSAVDDKATVAENSSKTIDVLSNDDVDKLDGNGGDTLTLVSVGNATYGTATKEGNLVKYVPNANLRNTTAYEDSFLYTMKDSSETTSWARVIVTVTPVNDNPTISVIANVTNVQEDAANGTGELSFNVTDEEDDYSTLTVTAVSGNPTLFPTSLITIASPTTNPDGGARTVQVIPAANQFGTGKITLTVKDSNGATARSEFWVTVASVNDIPNNGDKSFTVLEDVKTQLDVRKDIDPDSATTPDDILITGIATNPTHGTAIVSDDQKSIYYTTDKDSNEPDSFQYTIHDSYGDANYTFTVNITVTPVNDAPVLHYAGSTSYTVWEGTALNDIAFSVTDVDNITDGSKSEVKLSAASSNLVLLRNGIKIDTLTGDDRNIDLQPYLKWNGKTTVTITAVDPGGLKDTASFALTVNNINDVPVAVDDTATILEDKTTSVYVLYNDTDADLQTNADTEWIKIHSITDNDAHASFAPSENGKNVLITPVANYNGPVSFTYDIWDSHEEISNTATVLVTVQQVNDAPVTQNDTASTAEETAVVIPVLDNDSDVDKDTTLNATPTAETLGVLVNQTGLTGPSHGAVTTDGTTVTYTPNTNYNGTDTFEYYCDDGEAKTKGSVTVTISQVNDNPVAVADTATTTEDHATDAIDVLANDTDVDTDTTLNLGTLRLHDAFTVSDPVLTTPAHGSVAVVDNKLVFTPAKDWNGEEVVTYTVHDGNDGSATGTLTVTVTPENDLPVFETPPATMELKEDSTNGVASILVSDVETAANLLSVTVVSSSRPALIATTNVVITAGTGGNRTVTVNPKDNQNGTADIKLQVTDVDGGKTTVIFTVNVEAVNDAPTASDRSLSVNEDGSATLSKTNAFTDVDVSTNADKVTVTIVTQAQHGLATVQTDGSILYKPTANYNGTDFYTYQATDLALDSVVAKITYTVAQVNDAPVTQNDTASTAEDNAIVIPVLDNDTDVDKDTSLNATPGAEVLGVLVNQDGLTGPSHGAVTTNGTTVTYTPTGNYNGTDTFEYYCNDGDVSVKGSVLVTISQVNDNPIAVADTATTKEDHATDAIDVLANDTDVDTDALLNLGGLRTHDAFTVSDPVLTTPAHGTVAVQDNKLVFTPAQDWNGEEVVTYTVNDGNDGSATGTLTVTVTPENDLPVYTTSPANMSLTEDVGVGTSEFVVGDVETAANLLAVTVDNISNTTLVGAEDITIEAGTGGNRTITVNPKDDQNGTAEITLLVTDADGGTAIVKFTVTVEAANDAPTATDARRDIDEDTTLLTIQKSAVSGDVDIATNADTYSLAITTGAQHGSAGIDKDGNLTYVPTKDFNGTDSFVFTATDASKLTGTATITIYVAQVNDAPVTQNDAVGTNEDKAVVIPVLDNDSDVDKDTSLNADPSAEVLSVLVNQDGLTGPSHGAVTTNGTTVTYTPNTNYNGTDTFEYYCNDGDVKVKGSVTVTISQVNDNPVAVADTVATDEDHATVAVDVLANDTDVDTDGALNLGKLHLRDTFTISAASVTDKDHGKVDIVSNKLVFTPATDWFGVEVVNYTISDGNEGSANGTLTVTVNSVNDLPYLTMAPGYMYLTEDGADGNSQFYVNDVETATSLLSVTVKSSSNPTLVDTTDITIVHTGGGGRSVIVNPKNDQNGSTLVTLTLEDADGGKTDITMEVHVAAGNDKPIADTVSYDINEDAGLQTRLKADLTSDVDIATNGDSITLSITSPASHGTATIDTNGDIAYQALANFNGTDSFEYTATDQSGGTATATLTFRVAPINDAPVAGDDEAITTEDHAVVIPVLTNDSDVDMDKLLNKTPGAESIGVLIKEAGLDNPIHGDITTDGTTITYTPDADFNGTDTFTYYCYDGYVKTEATVTVSISQVNDNPLAVEDSGSTGEDELVSVNVLKNDTDVDTDELLNLAERHEASSLYIDDCYTNGGTHGTLEIDGANIIFDPETDFSGTQIIKYVLKDGHGGEAIGTLTIAVDSENDAPVAVNDEASAEEDHVVSINVLVNDTDVDPVDTKTFVRFGESTSGLPGTFTTKDNGDITFTPNANYNGTFTIPYVMQDAGKLTSSAQLKITITPVNDAPVAGDTSVTTNEDTAKNIDVSGLIDDADLLMDGDTLTVTITTAGEPKHGTATVDGTTIAYKPTADFNGADAITYTVTDKGGLQDTGKITITIDAVNDKPVAVNDTKTTREDTAVEIFALTNDTDVDTSSTLNASPALAPTIQRVYDGTHGTAVTDGTKITYTPDKDYNGTDTLSYVISDGETSATASVSLTITQVNDPIQAVNDTAETNDEDLVTIDVLYNDTDVDTDKNLNEDALHSRDSFSITAVGKALHGTTKLVSGKIAYTPDDRFAGPDSFTYTVSDGHGSSAQATVTVTVISVNDPPETPVVSKPAAGDRAGTGSKVEVVWSGFDIDGDVLSYRLEYYDGKDWILVAEKLTDTKYTFALPDSLASTDGLQFRVNASDSEYTSDYGYSGAMKVDKDAPTGTVVTMKTADGRTYTAGVWTNQTVRVVASSAVDASDVTYYYAMDSGASAAATGMDVTTGVHTVNIVAKDVYGNAASVGGYLARVDKQQPATPVIKESVSASGTGVVLTLTLQTDPGGSGNDKLTLPDGTTVNASGNPTYTAAKNGTFNFTLTDVAGNRKAFTYTVSTVDTSKPTISLASGAYRIGTTTQSAITATLTFADPDSELVTRGYQISTSSAAGNAYKTYNEALMLSDPGTYYIHAFAKNAFGLTAYQTFGPFIIEVVAEPEITPTPVPEAGDVVVTKEDIADIPGDTVYIRLPGQEWSETLTLEDVGPGDYIVEAMDADGNIRTVEVHVTMRDIIARSLRSAGEGISPAAIAALAVALAAAILFLFLAASYNITVTVFGISGGADKKIRAMRRIKFRKQELVIKLEDRHVKGGEYVNLKIAKQLSKKMRNNWVVVTLHETEILRVQIPEDMDEAFQRKIMLEQ